jgi:hypothetical protein
VVRLEEKPEKSSPTFYLALPNEGPFLSHLLSKIDDPSQQSRLKAGMAALCNKAIIAEPLDLFEIEEMKRVTRKVFHYLNLGLQYVSHEAEERALEVILSIPLQKIFQWGVTATLLIKKKAESILKGPWFSGDRDNLTFLDSPHFEKIEGILKKRPQCYRGGALDDFKSLEDLKEAETFLEMIEVIVNFLGEKLMVTPPSLRGLDLTHCHPRRLQEMTLSTIFLTALANQIVKGVYEFKPIEKTQLKDLFPRIFEKNEQGRGVIRMKIKNRLRDRLSLMEADENKRYHLLAFRDFCLDLFEEEFGRIPPEEEIDPRFVKGLLVRT